MISKSLVAMHTSIQALVWRTYSRMW